jgi:hypothetical protein
VGCSEVKVTAAQSLNCSRNDLGGEQTWGPEHNGITAISLKFRTEVTLRVSVGADLVLMGEMQMLLWEKTGKSTIGSHRGKGPSTYARIAEVKSGRANFQQGLTIRLRRTKTLRNSGRSQAARRVLVWRMSPYEQ